MSPDPRTYAIRIDGHLDDHWSTRFGGLTITRNGDATTTLAGQVADQAQLHGALAGLRDIGATLLSLHATDLTGAEPPSASRPVLDHPLRTARLTLRPAHIDDADRMRKLRQLVSATEWPTDRDAAHFAEPARLATTVVIQLGDDPEGEIIGDLTLRREDAPTPREPAGRGAQAELGWILDPAYRGHGYATEAVRELLRHGFEDLGLRRVTAGCFLGDDTSWQLMERVGLRRESHAVRGSLHRSGQWLDTVTYALLADEWKS